MVNAFSMYEISHMLRNKRGSVLLKFHFPTPLLPPLSPPPPASPCPARRLQESGARRAGRCRPPARTQVLGYGGGTRARDPRFGGTGLRAELL